MDGVPLYGRPITVNHSVQNSNSNSPGTQSPSNYGYGFPDDAQLRRPLFNNPNGQYSHHTGLLTPPPLIRNAGVHGNFQQGYSSPRSPWDMMSPWQQNGAQGYPGRNSPQSGHSSGPQFRPLQTPNRQFRPYHSY